MKRVASLLIAIISFFTNQAQTHVETVNDNAFSSSKGEKASVFVADQKPVNISKHITWGFEVGTSIDVSGYDSSTFNVDAIFGYKNELFPLIGLGIGVHKALGNSDNYVPIYATLRTSFTRQPKMFFMSLKVGYSFNTIGDANTFGDINASVGGGINLAVKNNFKSYLILAYEFRHFNQKHRASVSIDEPNVSMASLTVGFNF